MHTCQIMLIEADSAEEAIDYAKTTITYSEFPYPAWSDWHGGLDEGLAGRWAGLFQGWEENRDVLGYTENSALAEDIIKEFVGYRKAEMKRYLEQITVEGIDIAKMIADYNPDKYDYGSGMNAWALLRLGRLLSNDWCSDTGVYDLTAHSANLEFFRERLAKEPHRQYLVPIDFHF
jgi:hypothetical protein